MATTFIWDAATLVRPHPYEYLFYNSLVGDLKGASRRYVMDYWVNIMPAAVNDLETYLDQAGTPAYPIRQPRYIVQSVGSGSRSRTKPIRACDIPPDWDHADFFICTHAHELRPRASARS